MNQEIDDFISDCHRSGYSQVETRSLLSAQFQTHISQRHFKRHLQRLGLFRRKNHSDIADVSTFIMEQLETHGCLHGYRFMHLKCLRAGLVVNRETVLHLMHILDEEGVIQRTRGHIVRRRYLSKGPNFLWHIDCYDKLKPYGIAISGCIDGFSRRLIWLKAYRTSSDPKIIAGYYVTVVEALKGCPMRVRADMGTENGTVSVLQCFLRRDGTDSWAGESSFLYGKSTANQRIEAFWSILRKQYAQYWISLFHELKDHGYFSGTYIDKQLIRFCFMALIQVTEPFFPDLPQ